MDEHLPALGLTAPENLLHMAVLANTGAAMENLVAVIAQQLRGGTLIKFHQGLIYLENVVILIINGQWVRKAVKNPPEKFAFQEILFLKWRHKIFKFFV
jgi:DNA helicase HerA-like ATPase